MSKGHENEKRLNRETNKTKDAIYGALIFSLMEFAFPSF
jgi:hypothetical protein